MIKESARSLLQDTQEYEDTGCEASEKCTECPLPKCRYDDDSWFYSYKLLAGHYPVIKDLNDGVPVPDIAAKHKYTERTIFRLKNRIKKLDIDYDVVMLFLELGLTSNRVKQH